MQNLIIILPFLGLSEVIRRTPTGAAALLGDKGYDSDAFIQAIQDKEMQAVIPHRNDWLEFRACDWFVYKERHLIECFFGKIKHYRRIFHDLKNGPEITWALFFSAFIWLE